MRWLNDIHEEAIDDTPNRLKRYLYYSRAVQILSCSKESANSIHFWHCFEQPYLIQKFGIFSKSYREDMLSQYVSGHHHGRTPLQLSAVNLAYSLALKETEMFQNLETMIVCIIEGGADIHEADHYHTPFIVFLAYFTGARHLRSKEAAQMRPRDLRRVMKAWLSILQRAGVNLVAYGAQESRIHQAFRSMGKPLRRLQPWYNANSWGFRDIFYFTFSYGPTPEAWIIQLDMVEEYASDFWRMPDLSDESVLQAIPGSWIDT
jgi:hypothetical protein